LPFWRRDDDEPAHERLAREAGIDLDGPGADDEGQELGEPVERNPFLAAFREVGIHGLHRQRRWDAVATANAPDLKADELDFVTLPDGTVLVDAELPEGALAPLADAIERELDAPYRARAIRRDDGLWAVSATSIDVVEAPEEIDGDSVSLAVQGSDRTLLIDERPGWSDVPTLEAYARERHSDFVLQAERLDGNLWSVHVNAL
jgi:hypothetical protein